MPLVEIIRGTKTSAEAVATAFDYAKKIKKSPILVRSGPGFLVNRLLLPYMSEAVELLLEGVEPRTVDRVATRFGMPRSTAASMTRSQCSISLVCNAGLNKGAKAMVCSTSGPFRDRL